MKTPKPTRETARNVEPENRKPKIIKASRLLQAKVGSAGSVDEELVRASQKIIDNANIDFAPMAKGFLEVIQKAMDDARAGTREHQAVLADIVESIMQLKANAPMFDFELSGTLANIMLNFLEMLETIDADVLDLVDAHQRTQLMIINNKMKGDGGELGVKLTAELKGACKRYFAKQASAGNLPKDGDAFFVDG